MELSRSVDQHIIMIARKYFDHLRVTDGAIKIWNCSSVFLEILPPSRRGVLIFFLVRSKIFYLIISLLCVQVQR